MQVGHAAPEYVGHDSQPLPRPPTYKEVETYKADSAEDVGHDSQPLPQGGADGKTRRGGGEGRQRVVVWDSATAVSPLAVPEGVCVCVCVCNY